MGIRFKPLENEFCDDAPEGAVALFASAHELTLLLSDGSSYRSEAVPGGWTPYANSGYPSHRDVLIAIDMENSRVGKASPHYKRFHSGKIRSVASAWFEALVRTGKSSAAEVSYSGPGQAMKNFRRKTGVFVCDSVKTAKTVAEYVSGIGAGTFAKVSERADSASGETRTDQYCYPFPNGYRTEPGFQFHGLRKRAPRFGKSGRGT